MELIDMLVHRRLARELRRREAALQEAARAPSDPEPRPLLARESEPELLARHPSTTGGRWECDFCGRGFHGYGSYLNHRCDGDGAHAARAGGRELPT